MKRRDTATAAVLGWEAPPTTPPISDPTRSLARHRGPYIHEDHTARRVRVTYRHQNGA